MNRVTRWGCDECLQENYGSLGNFGFRPRSADRSQLTVNLRSEDGKSSSIRILRRPGGATWRSWKFAADRHASLHRRHPIQKGLSLPQPALGIGQPEHPACDGSTCPAPEKRPTGRTMGTGGSRRTGTPPPVMPGIGLYADIATPQPSRAARWFAPPPMRKWSGRMATIIWHRTDDMQTVDNASEFVIRQ